MYPFNSGFFTGDPYFALVRLLFHGNPVADSSLNPLTLTNSGASLGSQSPYTSGGAGSPTFNGTSNYISIPASSKRNLGTGDFTIETWVYPTTLTGAQITILDSFSTGPAGSFTTGAWQMVTGTGGGVGFIIADSASTTVQAGGGSAVLNINAWNHVAVVRKAGVITVYINGVPDVTTLSYSGQVGQSTGAGSIGRQTFNNAFFFTGRIADFRVTGGIARYTASFAPPSVQFADA